jgi:hypothetical protein
MKHMTQRAIPLIAMALLLSLWPSADAQFAGALRGDYKVTLTRTCAFDALLNTPTSGQTTGSIAGPFNITGTLTYNGTGGGSLNGQQTYATASGTSGTGIDVGGGSEIIVNQANVSCPITYTMNPDGTFTQTMNCTLTFTLGGPPPQPGQTVTLNGITLQGQLALDGTVLIFGTPPAAPAAVETNTVTTGTNAGFTNKRFCTNTGSATSRR